VSNNKYKLVKSFQLDSTQQITAFSAINSFHSCTVFNSVFHFPQISHGGRSLGLQTPQGHTMVPLACGKKRLFFQSLSLVFYPKLEINCVSILWKWRPN